MTLPKPDAAGKTPRPAPGAPAGGSKRRPTAPPAPPAAPARPPLTAAAAQEAIRALIAEHFPDAFEAVLHVRAHGHGLFSTRPMQVRFLGRGYPSEGIADVESLIWHEEQKRANFGEPVISVPRSGLGGPAPSAAADGR